MIERWELTHVPFEKDAQRYKVRIRGTESDLEQLVQKMPPSCGRPFVTLSQEYNWAFYLYQLSDSNKSKVVEILQSFSPKGTIVDTSELRVESEMPPMMEDVLEATLKMIAPNLGSSPKEIVRETKGAGPVPAIAHPAAAPAGTPKPPPSLEEILSTPLNAGYIFSEFIVGPNNRFTHAAAQAVAENPGKIYNPFFIYGGVGLGKTHLMHAIGHAVQAKNPQAKVLFVSTAKLMGQVIETIRQGGSMGATLRERYSDLDLLLIDDVQFLAGSETTQEEFFLIFNSLHEQNKQIVITSDRAPKQLSTLTDRLRSRFEWGLITDLKPPNLETRIAILKKKAETIPINLSEEQLLHIAEKSKSNIRELEGILKHIHAQMKISGQPFSESMLSNLLGEEEIAKTPDKPVVDFTNPARVNVTPFKEDVKPGPVPLPREEVEPRKFREETRKEQESALEALSEVSHPVELSDIAAALGQPKSRQELSPEPLPPPPPEPEKPKARPPIEEIIARQKLPVEPEPEPPEPEPAAIVEPLPDEEDVDPALRPVSVVCFYPRGKENDFSIVKQKFNVIMKKHKLKIRLQRMAETPYDFEEKVDYNLFAKESKRTRCPNLLVLGPPPTPILSEDDFAGTLSTLLDEQKISLQFIPWSEISKDYRYLNCALDLSLLAPS